MLSKNQCLSYGLEHREGGNMLHGNEIRKEGRGSILEIYQILDVVFMLRTGLLVG